MAEVKGTVVGAPKVDKDGNIYMGDGDVTNEGQVTTPQDDTGGLFSNLFGTVKDKVTDFFNGPEDDGNVKPPLQTGEGGGTATGENSGGAPQPTYGVDKADYFANTAAVTQKANAKLIEDQLTADAAAMGVLEKTQAQNQDAGEQIYGAEYSNRQMTDKFGWTGGQLMDSETRMQALRDQLSAGILSNEQYIDAKYANDITKAKAAMVGNRMAIAQQAAKDAYSNALAVGQLTGVYVDPIAGDLVGRYVTDRANNPDGTLDPALESQLIAAGFYTEVDGVKQLSTEAIDAISGVMNSLDRDSWTMGLKTALLEQGYTVDEINNLMSTSDLIAAGEEVETADDPYAPNSNVTDPNQTEEPVVATEEELEEFSDGDTREQDGVTQVLEDGKWVEQTFAGLDGKQVQGMTEEEYSKSMGYKRNADGTWTKMSDEEMVGLGMYKNESGQWVDWYTDQEGIKQMNQTSYDALYADWADGNQSRNEYDAAFGYYDGSNLYNNSAELLTAIKNGSEITITATSDNKAGKGLYNDEYAITYVVNGQNKTLKSRGVNLLIASALYGTDFGGNMDLLQEIFLSQSRGAMSGNEYDGGQRIFGNYWYGEEENHGNDSQWNLVQDHGYTWQTVNSDPRSLTEIARDIILQEKLKF